MEAVKREQGGLSLVTTSTVARAGIYVVSLALAVLTTYFVHEGAHWATGELLGNRMTMTLNAAFPTSGRYLEAWHAPYVTAAGPMATLLQALLAYLAMRRYKTTMLYAFLLTPAIMRVLALGMNVVNPQDEGRLGLSLGIGLFTLPVLVCIPLLYLAVQSSRRERYSRAFNIIAITLIVFFSSVLILASQ